MFRRELRYIVLKYSDMKTAGITLDELSVLKSIMDKVDLNRDQNNKIPLECAVIESDWPEYEPVWKMIEDRMEQK